MVHIHVGLFFVQDIGVGKPHIGSKVQCATNKGPSLKVEGSHWGDYYLATCCPGCFCWGEALISPSTFVLTKWLDDHLVFPCWNCDPGEQSKITMMMLCARYDHYWSLLVQGTMIMITTFGLWSCWRVSDNNDIAVCKVYFLSFSSSILVQGIFLSLLSLFLVQGVFSIFFIINLGASCIFYLFHH